MEEKIVNALQELGFVLQHPESGGKSYMFNYEGTRYVYMPNDNDSLLNIVIPFAVDHEDYPGVDYAALTQRANSQLCFVKAYVQYDNIWLAYEQYLMGDEEGERLKEIIARMVQYLDQGKNYIRGFASEMMNDGKEDEL